MADLRGCDLLNILYDELSAIRPWQEIDLEYELELKSLIFKRVSSLSGGENQRIKFAMLLMQEVDCYLMDEPLQFLDQQWQKHFIDIFGRLAKEKIVTIIEHDVAKYEVLGPYVNQMNLSSNKKIRISYRGA